MVLLSLWLYLYIYFVVSVFLVFSFLFFYHLFVFTFYPFRLSLSSFVFDHSSLCAICVLCSIYSHCTSPFVYFYVFLPSIPISFCSNSSFYIQYITSLSVANFYLSCTKLLQLSHTVISDTPKTASFSRT